MDDFGAFARLLDALRPWLGHVVIIGGWAHRLHRFHPLSHPRSGLKRNGQPDVTAAKAGITAQKLRHLELLLVSPWRVRLANEIGVPVQSPVDVMLANPVSFIAQKILIEKHRTSQKKAQDALYIHDTLELFGGDLTRLRTLWQQEVRPTLPDKTARTVENLQREQFGTLTDVIRNAARIPQDRVLPPERIQAACAYGLEEVFGQG